MVIWFLVLVEVSRRCVESLFGLIHPQECKNNCLLGLMESIIVTISLGEYNNDNSYIREEVNARGVGTSRPQSFASFKGGFARE
jgi:hypothetical protein